jgi:ribonuclease HI
LFQQRLHSSAEIIAIKIVLDYFINSKDQELHNITIISDSQSALGILTLNWKSENYFQSISEIKSQINYLKEQGVVVSFNWTPGHASIKGNEIADQFAKEAAKEAEAQCSHLLFLRCWFRWNW